MAEVIEIKAFLEYLGKIPLLDVRSEGEYEQGHVPGAFNIALLNNEHRAIVGTTYKQQGREQAVLKGFELMGPHFNSLLQQWLAQINGKQVMLYCWRGGMRSNIAAWMLGLCGVKVFLLKGGYKAYRHWVQQQLLLSKKTIVLGGPTGAGKTVLLHGLKEKGEQVIDLEKLANHRGSAFGALGMEAQPSYEHFENMLALEWAVVNDKKWVWIENESRLVGVVKIPDSFFAQMRDAPVLAVELPRDMRMKHIMKEYGQFNKEELIDCTKKVKKRLGDLRTKQAIQHLEQGEMKEWLEILLDYYDKFYTYNNTLREKGSVHLVSFIDESIEVQVEKLMRAAEKL